MATIAVYRCRFSNELTYQIRLGSQDQLPCLPAIDSFKVEVRFRRGLRTDSRNPHSTLILAVTPVYFSSSESPFPSFFSEGEASLRRELSHPNIPGECADAIVSVAMNYAKRVIEDPHFVTNPSPMALHLAIDVVFECSVEDFLNELLKKVKFGGETEECSICFVEFKKDEELSATSCQHLYHRECILKWLEQNSDCPFCRQTLGILM